MSNLTTWIKGFEGNKVYWVGMQSDGIREDMNEEVTQAEP